MLARRKQQQQLLLRLLGQVRRKTTIPMPVSGKLALQREDIEGPLKKAPPCAFKKDAMSVARNDFMWEPATADLGFIVAMSKHMKYYGDEMSWWEAETVMKKSGLNKVRPYHLAEILKSGVQPGPALKLFRWAKTQPNYFHDTVVFNNLLKVLGFHEQFNVMEEYFQEMGKRKVCRNEITYMTMVHCFFKGGEVQKALHYFDEFEQMEPKPLAKYYKYVLHQLLKAGCVRVLPLIFRNMQWAGHRPDTITYNMVVNSLCQQGEIDEALKYIKEMWDQQMQPDVFTYTHIMEGLGKTTNLEAASRVFEDMVAKGCRPNVKTCNVLMETICRAGKTAQAVEMLRKMVDWNCLPDSTTYQTLMGALGRSGEVDLAYNVVRELPSKGVFPNQRTYNTLMSRLNHVGKAEAALVLFQDMKRSGTCLLDKVSYNIAIDLLGKCGRVDEACRTLEEMKSLGLRADKYTYNSMICRLSRCGRLDICFSLLDEMQGRGIQLQPVSYTILVEGLCREGLIDKAWSLFQQMKASGMSPPLSTLQSILRTSKMVNRLDLCKELMPELEQAEMRNSAAW